jgi:tetrahydromethanopterin S-methyltransferase subunit G
MNRQRDNKGRFVKGNEEGAPYRAPKFTKENASAMGKKGAARSNEVQARNRLIREVLMEELNKDYTFDTDDLDVDTTELMEDEIGDLEDELEAYEAEEAARRAKKKKRIILIAGIVVGLAIAAVLIAVFANKRKNDD